MARNVPLTDAARPVEANVRARAMHCFQLTPLTVGWRSELAGGGETES